MCRLQTLHDSTTRRWHADAARGAEIEGRRAPPIQASLLTPVRRYWCGVGTGPAVSAGRWTAGDSPCMVGSEWISLLTPSLRQARHETGALVACRREKPSISNALALAVDLWRLRIRRGGPQITQRNPSLLWQGTALSLLLEASRDNPAVGHRNRLSLNLAARPGEPVRRPPDPSRRFE